MSDVTTDDGGETNEREPDGTLDHDERLAYRGVGQRFLTRPEAVGVMFALVLYLFFWAVTTPFGNASGAATVLDLASSPLGIMAVAVAVLMIGGEFDLSAGAMTGTMAIIIVLLVKETGDLGGAGLPYVVAIPISLAIALGIGYTNGWMVEKTALPSFIVTLGTFFVLRGFKLAGSKIIVDQIQVGRADEGQGYDFWRKIFGSTWERQDHIWEARDLVYTVCCIAGGLIVVFAVYELSYLRNTIRNAGGLGMMVLGVVGIAAGVVLAHVMDGNDWVFMAVIAVSGILSTAGVCLWRYERQDERGQLSLGSGVGSALGIGTLFVIASMVVMAVLDPYSEDEVIPFVTEQGLRAILAILGLTAAAAFVSIGIYRTRNVSPLTTSVAMSYAGLVIFVLALFVQSESESQKFRTELFGTMCVLALFMVCWGVGRYLAKIRRFEDRAADRLGRRLAVVGAVLVVIGLTVKLLFATQDEVDAGATSRLALFSIRIVWFLAFAAVMTWILRKTPFGSWTYAVGGNKEAARQIGVPMFRTKKQLFMLVAFAAWLVGMLLTFRLNTIQAGTGNGEEFEYIIAAVVGGTLLTGGYGTAVGAMVGAFIMAMSQQGPSFAGWNTDWRFVFLGVILLASAYANSYVRKRAEAAR